MRAPLRLAALALVVWLSGCAKPNEVVIPAGSVCVDGYVWAPNAGTEVMTPVRDSDWWLVRCVPASKESR